MKGVLAVLRRAFIGGSRVRQFDLDALPSTVFESQTQAVVEVLVPQNLQGYVFSELNRYCKHYKYTFHAGESDVECPERFLFAILKIGMNSGVFQKNDFDDAVELGMFDYRDLLGSAGFENDINLHEKWAKASLVDERA